MSPKSGSGVEPEDHARALGRAPTPLLSRIGAIGATAQASVPGLYAWGVTVAPAAWSRGAPLVAKLSALAGLVALVAGSSLERRWGTRARYIAVWGLVITSAVTWIAAPAALGPLRLDAPRGVAGAIGWALFAFASAAPALRADAPPVARTVDADALRPRTELRRGDVIYIGTAIAFAAALQVLGWSVLVAERALLVRFSTLACGLAIIGASTTVSLARHTRTAPRSTRARLRGAVAWLVLLAVSSVVGVVWWSR
jgi:hypothetical protein